MSDQNRSDDGADGIIPPQNGPNASDRALLEAAAADAARDVEDREPGTLGDDDAIYTDPGAHPESETTDVRPDSGDGETEDGLSDLEESVRQQAEDRPTGNREDFTG